MAEITDREAPKDVPTTDALATLEDPDVDPDEVTPERHIKAEIQMSGKTLMVIEDPPSVDTSITLMIELDVFSEGREKRSGSDEFIYYRKTRLVHCWVPGGAKPERVKTKAEVKAEAEAAAKALEAQAAENQPPLFSDSGDVHDQDDDVDGGADDDDADSYDGDDEQDDYDGQEP